MRSSIWLSLVILIAVVALACNSNETLLSQSPQAVNKAATPAPPRADNVRLITAEELHKLWEKNEVTIIDTRTEPAFKQEHIKGAILVPAGTVVSKLEQLPSGKMIVAYCTCPQEQTSAAAVRELNTKGINNAAALVGGLGAWKAAGFPVQAGQ